MGFALKDFYNSLDVKRQSMTLKTDLKSTLTYLKRKIDMDMNFFYKYAIH